MFLVTACKLLIKHASFWPPCEDDLSSIIHSTKERSLAGMLAFISSIRDDTDHIPAVCVVEEPNSHCMGILLAANRVGFNDGTNILRDLEQGFDKIFHILEGRLDGKFRNHFNMNDISLLTGKGECDASSTESEVFTAIVSMCASRISSRLRLIPGRKRSRNSVKDSFLKLSNVPDALVMARTNTQKQLSCRS